MRYSLDLIALLPGEDDRSTIDALLSERWKSLGIRKIRYRLLKHPQRDPGCFHEAEQVLQPFQRQAHRALVMFDHQGSGQERTPPEQVRRIVLERLKRSGWNDRAEVLLNVPELEVWVWGPSPHVDRALGWQGHSPSLRQWLRGQGLWPTDHKKPPSPKEAVERACRERRIPRSAAIYRRIAERVGLQSCEDPGFQELRQVLASWFGSTTD